MGTHVKELTPPKSDVQQDRKLGKGGRDGTVLESKKKRKVQVQGQGLLDRHTRTCRAERKEGHTGTGNRQ